MDRLSGLLAFVRTVESSSFVEAGNRLGISSSAVGKSVARLEAQLGVRLLHRTTRRLGLTAEGALFFERCRRVLDDLDDAEAMVAQTRDAPRGTLRLSLPAIGYRFLVPHLPDFRRLYPEIRLDLDFNDQIVDIIGEGLDVVIRSGDLPDSRLMSRTLAPFRFVIAASPHYLSAHGRPATVADLATHSCLRFRFPASGRMQDWVLQGASPETLAGYPTALICNNMEGLLTATLVGLGVAYMPEFLAAASLADGSLVALLDETIVEGGQFRLIWPSGRQLSPKVRAFLDFASSRLFKGGSGRTEERATTSLPAPAAAPA